MFLHAFNTSMASTKVLRRFALEYERKRNNDNISRSNGYSVNASVNRPVCHTPE